MKRPKLSKDTLDALLDAVELATNMKGVKISIEATDILKPWVMKQLDAIYTPTIQEGTHGG